MTKQESIFEAVKVLYQIDLNICYSYLNKINFNELRLSEGSNSDLELDIRTLKTYISFVKNIDLKDKSEQEIVEIIKNIFNQRKTDMFFDNKKLAGYLLFIALELRLISPDAGYSLNISLENSFEPIIYTEKEFFSINAGSKFNNKIEDDIVKLNNLFKNNLLTKKRLDSYQPKNDLIPYLNLKVNFSIKYSLFDYGILAVEELLKKDKEQNYKSTFITFINTFISERGSSDPKIQNLISNIRMHFKNSDYELLIDKAIYLEEYRETLTKKKKIDLKRKLNSLIDRYKSIGIDTTELEKLKYLKGAE